jgi:hypothetical protein
MRQKSSPCSTAFRAARRPPPKWSSPRSAPTWAVFLPPLPSPPGQAWRRATTSARGASAAAARARATSECLAAHDPGPGGAGGGAPQTPRARGPLPPYRRSARAQESGGGARPCAPRAHVAQHRVAQHHAPPALPRARRRRLPAPRSRRAGQTLGPPTHAPGLRGAALCSASNRIRAHLSALDARCRLLTFPIFRGVTGRAVNFKTAA